MSNLKIDIIYFKTASDFEMEFNLSGCCRMRMFKDKVDTPKGLVNTLARDVSRSKITIIVTELFGQNNGVSILSNAVKLPLEALDKAAYGIQTADDIYMPKTAIPLVTKTGIYGGCIIENGPQSIIVVSNVRALRHEIMKTYVHNYVFDVGQMMAYQERMGSDSTIVPPKATALNSSKEEKQKEPSQVNDEPAEKDIASKSENNFTIVPPEDASESELGLMDEVSALKDIKTTKKKNTRKTSNIILLIIVILLLVGFGILAYFFVYLPLLGEPSVFTDGSGNIITEFLSGLFL